MESSDDDGDRAAVRTAGLIIPALVLLFACHKPSTGVFPRLKKDTAVTANKAALPVTKKKKTKKKKLYITFDDGPNKGTRNVLHIVQDEDVPVSFFIVGEHVFASRGQANMWDSLGIASHIELCNHSYTHAHSHYRQYYEDPAAVVEDFQRTQDSLQLTNRIARTPGRNIWRIDSLHFTDLKSSTAAADSLAKAGFILMGWDVEWHYDPKSMSVVSTAEEMIQQIDSAFAGKHLMTSDHLVLLAHDQVYAKPGDSLQLRKFLQGLKEKDEYDISLVTEYPGAE